MSSSKRVRPRRITSLRTDHAMDHARNSRTAMTLLEILLVLAILIAMAAVAWPSIQSRLAYHRLTSGADQVRAAWSGARVDAMASGRVHVFRCRHDSGENVVEPWYGLDDVLDSSEVESTEMLDEQEALLRPEVEVGTLPKGVIFFGGEAQLDSRSAAAAATLTGTQERDDDWSGPIFFYPDGTTATAKLHVSSESGQGIDLRLRGLTGVVTVGRPKLDEEVVR